MGYYVGLKGYKPAGRLDRKWTRAGILEAPDVGGQPGAWVEIEEKVLADYPDPRVPPVFDFDTTEATAPSGYWYGVEFRDGSGGKQESVPEYNGTKAVPDVEWIRLTSNVDFDELGYPEPAPGASDRLQYVLDEAVVGFQSTVGLDPRTVPETDKRIVLVRQALRMLVEYQAGSSTMEHLGTASDFDMLSGMSASDYSETRRAINRMNPQVLHPWPALNRLLSFIKWFDTGGAAVEDGPSVTQAPMRPRPFEREMKDLYGPKPPGAVTLPLWPQPWVTNVDGKP